MLGAPDSGFGAELALLRSQSHSPLRSAWQVYHNMVEARHGPGDHLVWLLTLHLPQGFSEALPASHPMLEPESFC